MPRHAEILVQLPEGGDSTVDLVRNALDGTVPDLEVNAHPGGVALSVPDAGAAIPGLLRQLEAALEGDLRRGGRLKITFPSPGGDQHPEAAQAEADDEYIPLDRDRIERRRR